MKDARGETLVICLCAITVSSMIIAAPLLRIKAYTGGGYDLSSDPKPGTRLRLQEMDIHSRKVDVSGRTLLVAAGSCTSCSLRSLRLDALDVSKFERAVIVFRSTAQELREKFEKPIPGVYIVDDPSGKLSNILNDLWTPRAYTLVGGALKDVSLDPDALPPYVTWSNP